MKQRLDEEILENLYFRQLETSEELKHCAVHPRLGSESRSIWSTKYEQHMFPLAIDMPNLVVPAINDY